MFLKIHYKKILVVTGVLSCLAAIYCIPFIDIHPQVPRKLPHVSYDFSRAPLIATSAKQYKIEKLFSGQLYGAESIEADSSGNLYLAIDGGFILYAQMNATTITGKQSAPKLWLLAELNEPVNNVAQNKGHNQLVSKNIGQRECRLDEQVYGPQLSSGGDGIHGDKSFLSKVSISRCSKPLGIRLSRDQQYLYVIDTLNGLYRINLRQAHENLQRSIRLHLSTSDSISSPVLPIKEKLLDFHIRTKKQVPLERMDNEIERHSTMIPVALTAIDDLVIDYGAGTNGADVIYMTDASQLWMAVSFLFDFMEARPTGLVLRLDTGTNKLSALENSRLSRVRMATPAVLPYSTDRRRKTDDIADDHDKSQLEAGKEEVELSKLSNNERNFKTRAITETSTAKKEQSTNNNNNDNNNEPPSEPGRGYGAPRFDSNDVFDDRPLFFPNGIELMDDRQALLIADTSNKRIIKHFIRGPRKGSTDLWTWTPHHPDNIRRGRDPNQETYWVAGCGRDRSRDSFIESLVKEDAFNEWPTVRMFMLKNLYLLGWTVEKLGQWLLRSQYVNDLGYSIKTGIRMMDSLCSGVMILQYDRHGELIKSIHGRDFPNDMKLLSQITQVANPEDSSSYSLYLGSPVYDYIYRLSYRTN